MADDDSAPSMAGAGAETQLTPLPQAPGLAWRAASTLVMAATGLISRAFLYGANGSVTVVGAESFCELLDRREHVGGRERGLITGMQPSRLCILSRCRP